MKAVMERRAPASVEADDARTAMYRRLDFFPTPPWAARAGAELVQDLYPAVRDVWEPACGEGHMAGPLREYFRVLSTDIHDHGHGAVQDFLDPVPSAMRWDAVITNPPFLKAGDFVRRGLFHVTHCVALLCRLSFLEGAERYRLFYEECNLVAVAPFAERVAMQLGSWDPSLSTATAYAWFVFAPGPVLGRPRIYPIAPGTKARLTKESDVRTYARAKDIPMFDSAGAVKAAPGRGPLFNQEEKCNGMEDPGAA